MTVKEFLSTIERNTEVIVKQHPIRRIDSSCNLVTRQRGSCYVLLYSNQNYLEYEVTETVTEDNITQVICKANPKQESKVIAAMYSLEMRG